MYNENAQINQCEIWLSLSKCEACERHACREAYMKRAALAKIALD